MVESHFLGISQDFAGTQLNFCNGSFLTLNFDRAALTLGAMFEASELFDLSQTGHAAIFSGCQYAWEALPKIAAFLASRLRPALHNRCEGRAFIGEKVFIGEGTVLEDGVMIKGPAIIGKNCQIRHNAYIRENVIIGDNCVVGNSTEVKNSLLFQQRPGPAFQLRGRFHPRPQGPSGGGRHPFQFQIAPRKHHGGDGRRAVRHRLAQIRRAAGRRL